MTRTDLEIANDFVHRWGALTKQRRARLGKQMPVAAMQVAALSHPDVAMRRFCLFLLDHYASDMSSEIFRRALHDPIPSVREGALHGLACERCRHQDICVTDVVTDLVELLTSDPNADVRHKTVAALARFVGRDSRAGEAIAQAAHRDPDSAIRNVAQDVADSSQSHTSGAARLHCVTYSEPRTAFLEQQLSRSNVVGTVGIDPRHVHCIGTGVGLATLKT